MKTLQNNASNVWGAKGDIWFKQLPDIITHLTQHWHLDHVTPVINMSYNYVAKATKNNSIPVVLKISCDKKLINMEQVIEWQSRPLDAVYPIVYLDCIVVKIREDKRVINKSIYLALGINVEGHKELLGLWLSENEGTKFWLSVLTELKTRGVEQILIACVDGLSGFPDAINTVYPAAKVQLWCVTR